ncbi:hypothetical protein [Streptomyces sp. NPDC002845]
MGNNNGGCRRSWRRRLRDAVLGAHTDAHADLAVGASGLLDFLRVDIMCGDRWAFGLLDRSRSDRDRQPARQSSVTESNST